jgi:Asp-tRNA(Asn)/Glu-tRNA(Gln) amidotransferase A subunit family amidase
VPRLTVPPEGGHIGQVYQNTGPLARDVGDAALATRIMAGFHPSDPFSLRSSMSDDGRFAPVTGLRALWLTFDGAAKNEAVIEHVRAAAARLGEIGIGVEDDGSVMDNGFEALGFLMRCHLTRYFRELVADPARRAMLTPESLGWAELCESRPIPIAEEVAAWRTRGALADRYAALFDTYDLLLTPTFSDVAAPIPDGWESPVPVGEWAAATYGVNGTGLAAASVPCGFVDGLPVGLQIIAPPGSDDLVLDVSHAIEAHWPWAGERPAAAI